MTQRADTQSEMLAHDTMSRAPIPMEGGRPVYVDTTTGKTLQEKPEELTHLQGNLLVPKTHPRILFRGKLDSLMADVLLLEVYAQQAHAARLADHLQEVLEYLRAILGAEVKNGPLQEIRMEGMDAAQIRWASHNVKESCGIDHPIPDASMGLVAMQLNQLRTRIREVELAAAIVFTNAEGICCRKDIVEGLNRLSSYVYILFCREAAAVLAAKGKTVGTPMAQGGNTAAMAQGATSGEGELITEAEAVAMIHRLGPGEHQIRLHEGAIITPSARDVFLRHQIDVIE